MIQGGEDVYGARSLEFIFHKRALYLVVLLQKETCNLRHSMYLRHLVFIKLPQIAQRNPMPTMGWL